MEVHKMSNIIRSDWYRLNKTKRLLVLSLVTCGIVGLLLLVMFASNYAMVSIANLDMQSGQSSLEELEQAQQIITSSVNSVSGFVQGVSAQNFMLYLIIPVFIFVFGADFDDKTFKNTLSFESNRNKVYFGKLSLSIIISIGLQILSIAFAFVIGLIFVRNISLSGTFFINLVIAFLLQLPILLAVVCTGHCVLAFTKKTGPTIAISIVSLIVISLIAQLLTMLLKQDWIMALDPSSAFESVANPSMHTAPTTFISVVFFAVIAVATTAIGSLHYKQVDMP